MNKYHISNKNISPSNIDIGTPRPHLIILLNKSSTIKPNIASLLQEQTQVSNELIELAIEGEYLATRKQTTTKPMLDKYFRCTSVPFKAAHNSTRTFASKRMFTSLSYREIASKGDPWHRAQHEDYIQNGGHLHAANEQTNASNTKRATHKPFERTRRG
jgi:hypothetical protein